MKNTEIRREHRPDLQHSIISWKSVFSGLVVSMFVYVVLLALGGGIGGSSASDVIQEGTSANGLATGAAIWIAVSVILSLAAGAYFAARTSTFITGRIGAAQGLIIAALFFGFMVYGAGQTLGIAGRGLGSVASAVGIGANNIAQSSIVKDTVEDQLNSLNGNLKSSPTEVAQGLMARLIEGNTASAKNYFAYETGLSADDLNVKFNQLDREFKSTVRSASVKTADGISKASWTFFILLALGMGSALLSGAMGTSANLTNPLVEETGLPSYVARPITI